MTKNENKLALVWFADHLTKFEANDSHARIVIDIVDGKAHHSEVAEKHLFKA